MPLSPARLRQECVVSTDPVAQLAAVVGCFVLGFSSLLTGKLNFALKGLQHKYQHANTAAKQLSWGRVAGRRLVMRVRWQNCVLELHCNNDTEALQQERRLRARAREGKNQCPTVWKKLRQGIWAETN